MLDTSNPHSADIVAASRQMDIILQLCKLITFNETAAERRYTLRIFQPAFAALRWLNAERFGPSPAIEAGIGELQAGAAALAALATGEPAPGGDYPPKTCPARGTALVAPGRYSPTPYCPKCLGLIMPSLTKLRSFEGGFGTEGI